MSLNNKVLTAMHKIAAGVFASDTTTPVKQQEFDETPYNVAEPVNSEGPEPSEAPVEQEPVPNPSAIKTQPPTAADRALQPATPQA